MAAERQGYELTPAVEIGARTKALQAKMDEQGLDLVLILQNVDLFYFTGTVQRGYLCIPARGEPLFFVQKYYERAIAESPVQCVKVKGITTLPGLLREYGIGGKRIGLELDVIPVSSFYRIQDMLAGWEIVDVSEEIKELRGIKSAFELRQIRQAGAIIDKVFAAARQHVREGMTELELDGFLVSVGRAAGHQGFLRMRGLNQEMTNIFVLSGASACVTSFGDTPLCGPGATPAIAQGSSGKRITRNEPIVIDYGGGYNGYVTDETRTFVIGLLDDRLMRAYGVARAIIADVESSARAGELTTSIYKRAAAMADKEGFGPHFMGYGEGQVTFVGHGLGLEINERPIIGRGGAKPLQAGMVFAFEPKFVFPDQGAVGIEVDYIVREDGLERITQFPLDLVSL
jgi:Xaa-Pro aminopeptidase